MYYNENNKYSSDMKKKVYDIVFAAQYEGLTTKQATDKLLGLFSVSGRFNSDNNEENKKVLTAILYEHTDEKEMKIREVDYEEVVKDIMEYF